MKTGIDKLLGMPVIENAMLPKGTAFLLVQNKGVVTQMVKVFCEQEQKPTAPSVLLEDLNELANNRGRRVSTKELRDVLSRYERAQEGSLAEMADRKGQPDYQVAKFPIGEGKYRWVIVLNNHTGDGGCHFADSYKEAEAKTRTYLNTLPDKDAK